MNENLASKPFWTNEHCNKLYSWLYISTQNQHETSLTMKAIKTPTALISKPTLRYLGFTPEKTYRTWNRWQNWPPHEGAPAREMETENSDPGYMPFIYFLTGGAYFGAGIWGDDDQAWITAMTKAGLDEATQEAIMDPRFRDVRLRENCEFWIENTLEIRYEALSEKLGANRRHGAASMLGEDQPASDTAADDDEDTHDDCVLLYTATTVERYRRMFDHDGLIRSMRPLQPTRNSGDLSSRSSARTLFPDRRLAALHAAYTHRRCPGAATLITLRLPQTALNALPPARVLKLGVTMTDVWRQLACGTGADYDLIDRCEELALLVAPAARWPLDACSSLENWRQVDDSFVWKRGTEQRAVMQWAFPSREGEASALWKNVTERMEAISFGEDEYNSWEEEETRDR